MRRAEKHIAFDTCHAAVPALLFAGILALTMFCVQPVLVALSLAGAFAFSTLARGVRATLAGLRWQLPMLALVCLANPLFSASGSTLLAKLGPVSIYLESLCYGATMGALMVAVVLWFEGAAAILTQDRLLGLGRDRAKSVSLVVSMAAQLAPQLLRRSRGVRSAQDACSAAGTRPPLAQRLARASGCARTSYRADALRDSDAARCCAIVLLCAGCAFLAAVACGQWRFYPAMPRLVAWWGYVPYAGLMFVPAAAAVLERLRWRDPR